MTEPIETQKSNSWCKCCDGKNENCRCFHHHGKKIVALLILALVFATGVGVGKLSSWRERNKGWAPGYYNEGRSNYRPTYPGFNQKYNQQSLPPNTASTSTASSSQR